MRYSELLEKSLGKITLAMHGAVDNCISAMHRDKLSDVELYALTGSVHSRGPSHSLRITYWNRALASGPDRTNNLLFSVLPRGPINI